MEEGGISLERTERDGGALLVLSGVLDASNSGALSTLLVANPGAIFIDLAEFDIDGSGAALEAVDAIRQLLAASGQLTLFNSPQLLGHTLYRVGLLEDDALRLVDTRQEEPYG